MWNVPWQFGGFHRKQAAFIQISSKFNIVQLKIEYYMWISFRRWITEFPNPKTQSSWGFLASGTESWDTWSHSATRKIGIHNHNWFSPCQWWSEVAMAEISILISKSCMVFAAEIGQLCCVARYKTMPEAYINYALSHYGPGVRAEGWRCAAI